MIAAAKTKPGIAHRLSQVDVSDLHNASVILNGDPAVIQLGEDQFPARLQSYLDLAPTLRERVAEIDYIDLRFDDRIYVRPTRGSQKLEARSEEGEVGRTKSEVRSQKRRGGADWREKNDTWSGSTSARRR